MRRKEDVVDRLGDAVQKASFLLGRFGMGPSETLLHVHDPLENFTNVKFGLDAPTQRASGLKRGDRRMRGSVREEVAKVRRLRAGGGLAPGRV